MKALVYEGPRKVTVKDMPDAKIERPTDVLVKITTTNICGSDLHMYEGRTNMETGRILGHENLGVVVEVGQGIERIKVGDRVCFAVQYRLRLLQELRARPDRLLPDGESGHGRRCILDFAEWAHTAAVKPEYLLRRKRKTTM